MVFDSCLTLQFTFLQDDVGIPLNYRHMEGFGVHTFTLINKEGKITYVKFHWKPTCGVKCLLEEEAVMVGGSNHSHATKVRSFKVVCRVLRNQDVIRVCGYLMHIASPIAYTFDAKYPSGSPQATAAFRVSDVLQRFIGVCVLFQGCLVLALLVSP